MGERIRGILARGCPSDNFSTTVLDTCAKFQFVLGRIGKCRTKIPKEGKQDIQLYVGPRSIQTHI